MTTKCSIVPVVVGERDLCSVGHCKGGLWRHVKRNVVDPVRTVVVPRQYDTANQTLSYVVLIAMRIGSHTRVAANVRQRIRYTSKTTTEKSRERTIYARTNAIRYEYTQGPRLIRYEYSLRRDVQASYIIKPGR